MDRSSQGGFPRKKNQNRRDHMLLFEKDIYPAFSSGDFDQIRTSLDAVIATVKKSSVDADTVFRLFNWSWPPLTSKARATSEDGISVVTKFTLLMIELLKHCSDPLIPQIAGCKLVLRSIFRGLNAIEPGVAVQFLEAVENRVLPQKAARGFFLDKAAVDQVLAVETDNTALLEVSQRLLEKILKSRRLYSIDQVVEFLVRIAKNRGCDSYSATLCSRVLMGHSSKQLYDSLMDKLNFLQLSAEDSNLKRLTILNFLIQIVGANCPGDQLAACISKSELTTPILNWQQNRLVALFTIRLVRRILERLPTAYEDGVVRDRLVELNSLLPVVKQIIAAEKAPLSQRIILLSELCSVVLEFKRALPGSFADCRFDWSKLLDEPNVISTPALKNLIGQLVFDIHKQSVPVTSSVARALLKLFQQGLGHIALNWFSPSNTGGGMLCPDSLVSEAFIATLLKHESQSETIVKYIIDSALSNPHALLEIRKTLTGDKSFISSIIESKFPSIAASIEKRIVRIGKRKVSEVVEGENDVVPFTPAKKLRTAPVTEELISAGKTTRALLKQIEASSSVNLIDLIGSEKLYSVILSLSSSDEKVRASAFRAIAIILRALAVSIEAKGATTNKFVFREAPQVAMILTWLRNGIRAPTEGKTCPDPIPLCSAFFIVEAIKVMFDPKNVLYSSVYKHVLARPSMQVYNEVSMWQSLFFSEDGGHIHAFRVWILDIVRKACMDPQSMDILVRRGVVEAMLDSAINLNGTADELDAVVDIVTRIADCAQDLQLVERFGICQWLQAVAFSRHVKFLDDS